MLYMGSFVGIETAVCCVVGGDQCVCVCMWGTNTGLFLLLRKSYGGIWLVKISRRREWLGLGLMTERQGN